MTIKCIVNLHVNIFAIVDGLIEVLCVCVCVLQDTVVALQALALFATLVFSLEGSSTVTVQSPSVQLVFDVNQNNKLLYQEEVLKNVTGNYSLEVKGSACASVQVRASAVPTHTEQHH